MSNENGNRSVCGHSCIAIVLAITALLLSACASAPATPDAPNIVKENKAAPVTEADPLATGRQLYLTNCAACHKENGTGGETVVDGRSLDPADLTSPKMVARPDDKIIRVIYNGIEDDGMPAFKTKLSEAEIREVVRYIRSGLQKK